MKDRLPDEVDTNARIRWRHNGTDIATRRRVNLIDGDNVTITVADSPSTEAVDVTIAAASSGGDSLWEEVAGELHPISEPTAFRVGVGGDTLVYADADDTILQSGSGTDQIDIDLNGSTGDININVNRDWNMGKAFGHPANRDFNVEFDNDLNLGFGNDFNFTAGRDFNLSADNDASIAGNRDTVIGSSGTDQVDIRTTATAPTDARMQVGSIVFYLDEAGNKLKVRVRYAGGTYKTGEIALT